MKSVFEASSSLDAHMILNLLGQEGIPGRIDGEYLPGGVGDLQAINTVRVMVDDADYTRAAEIIRAWEAIQVDREAAARKTPGWLSGFMLGVVIGGGLVFWAYSTPFTEDGIDHNGDGLLDEKWSYRDGRISRTEVDKNLDGIVDVVAYFDRRGFIEKADVDSNGDGVFDTRYEYNDYGEVSNTSRLPAGPGQ